MASIRFELKCICYENDYDINKKRLLKFTEESPIELRELLDHGAVKKHGVLFFVDRIVEGKNYCLNQLTYDFDKQQTVYRSARSFRGNDSESRFNSFCENFKSKGWEVIDIDNKKNQSWRNDNTN